MKGFWTVMKNNWQIAVAGLVLAVIFGFGFKGCSDKQQQDFRKGVKIGTAAAVEVRNSVKDYCRAELIKPESCAKLEPHTEKIADLAKRLDKFVDAHPKLTLENKQEALALVDDLIAEADALEAEGAIEFKDQDQRRKFLLALAIGKSAIRVARVSIDAAPIDSPSPSPSPQ